MEIDILSLRQHTTQLGKEIIAEGRVCGLQNVLKQEKSLWNISIPKRVSYFLRQH